MSGGQPSPHDVIEVRGARENNLKDVSLDIPKRRLTVFTGVSGSGKSSLVFGTIAAESPAADQRDLQASSRTSCRASAARRRLAARTSARRSSSTRSGWAPTPAPPSAPPPTRTRCCGSCSAGSASRTSAARARSASTSPRACARRARALGASRRSTSTSWSTATKSLNEGAIKVPNFASTPGTGRLIVDSGLFDPDKSSCSDYTDAGVGRTSSTSRATKIKVGEHQRDLRGPGGEGRSGSSSAKDRESMQPHIRAFVERAVTFTARARRAAAPGSTQAALASQIDGRNIADCSAMQISDLARVRRAASTHPAVGAAGRPTCRRPLDVARRDRPRLPQPRPRVARSPAARRSG